MNHYQASTNIRKAAHEKGSNRSWSFSRKKAKLWILKNLNEKKMPTTNVLLESEWIQVKSDTIHAYKKYTECTAYRGDSHRSELGCVYIVESWRFIMNSFVINLNISSSPFITIIIIDLFAMSCICFISFTDAMLVS